MWSKRSGNERREFCSQVVRTGIENVEVTMERRIGEERVKGQTSLKMKRNTFIKK